MKRRKFLTNSTMMLFAASVPLKTDNFIQVSEISSHNDLHNFSYKIKSVSEYLKSFQENDASENVYLVYWSTDQITQVQQVQNYCREWSKFENFKVLVENMATSGKFKALTSTLVNGEYYSIMIFEDSTAYRSYIDQLSSISKYFPRTDGLIWKVTEGHARITAGEISPLHLAKDTISIS